MGKGSSPRPFSVSQAEFGDRFETIFGKKNKTEGEKQAEAFLKDEYYDLEENVQVRVKENAEEFGNCGCGRSPTGKCCGWHALTEEAYHAKLEEYMTNREDTEGKNV